MTFYESIKFDGVKKWGLKAQGSGHKVGDIGVSISYFPLNSPFRFSMYAEIASARSSEGMIMLDLAAL